MDQTTIPSGLLSHILLAQAVRQKQVVAGHRGRSVNNIAMRLALLFFLIFSPLALSQDWRKMYEQYPEDPLDSIPKVSVVTKDADFATVRVINDTPDNLGYAQYEESSVPSLYWEEQISGKWQGTDWPWCGTGLSGKVIAPKGHLDIKIPLTQKSNPFKVFIRLSNGNTKKASFVLLYETK